MPHCIICNSTQEPQLVKGRFFCASCRNDLSAVECDSKRFPAMLEYLRLARQKNEEMQKEQMDNGGLTDGDLALAESIIKRTRST